MPRKLTTIMAAVFVFTAVALHARSQTAPSITPETITETDLRVWLEHVGGKETVYDKQLVRMELILNDTGRLEQIHLILRSGPEADTHAWYNVENLVSVRYQFLEITGKGKISVRTTSPPVLKSEESTSQKPIDRVQIDDYR